MNPTAMHNKWLGDGFGLALSCLLLLASLRCEAQNLVPNPSFEEYDTCQVVNDVYYPSSGPLGWFSAGWTPDHFMSCLTYGAFNGVPSNAWSFQYPQDGECYAGMLTYRQFPEGREYLMIELDEALEVGREYFASFYASPCWGGYLPSPQMWMATSGIGMIFTTERRQWELDDPTPEPLNYAHVYSEAVVADTVVWTLVSGSFVADSVYQYLMLGNPFDNESTDTLHFANQTNLPRGGMLIDNVCLTVNSEGCPSALGVVDVDENSFRLYPNPASDWIMLKGIEPGAHISVHDVLGRVVWKGRALGSLMHIDVQSWARGTYILGVLGKGKSKSIKFVLIE